MREPGFDDLADLWQNPEEADREAFEALARRARRRGRALAYADWALAAVLVGGSCFALLASPGRLTTVAAVLLLVATIWLTWHRRRLRQMAGTLETADRQTFIASSVRIARANLRRVTLSLVALPPLVLFALFSKMSARADPGRFLLDWAQSPRGMISLAVFAALIALSVRSILRIRNELARLEKLRQAYEQESRADGPGPG